MNCPTLLQNSVFAKQVRSLILSGVALSCIVLHASAEQPNSNVSFNEDIRPILNAHCTACHGGVKQAADLSFVYADSMDGIVEAGDPEGSYLLEKVLTEDEDERMPPPDHGRGLNDKEIELLTRWIKQGAKWGKHWAYEKPTRHDLPVVADQEWALQNFDAFVLARLEANSLTPSDDEKPHRWFRRVTLDLIGLPPTPKQLDTFLTDEKERGEEAYAAAVDRLLSSKHFGERWASVWFDLVRYADSKGLGLDNRRNIWKYRDWVIRSLNKDLPYDQFTIKQIAGDLMPNASIDDKLATAVHRLTQTNDEGGTDDEEFRVAAVLDRINTVWQTWQGTTFGCVQCHHHPYDPFEHEEFYQFAAFFNNTSDSDLPGEQPLLNVPLNEDEFAHAGELDREIESLQEKIWRSRYIIADDARWKPILMVSAKSTTLTRVAVDQESKPPQFHTVNTVTKRAGIQVECSAPAIDKPVTAVRLTALPLDPAKAVADPEWGFVLSHFKLELISDGKAEPQEIKFTEVIGDEPFPFHDPAGTLNPKTAQGYAAFTRIHHPRRAVFILAEPLELSEGQQLRISLKQSLESGGSHPLVVKRGYFELTTDKRYDAKNENLDPDRAKLSELNAQRRKIKSTAVPVIAERIDHLARPTHVFIRGLFLTKDKKVSADIPKSLKKSPDSKISNRLELAKWMVSEDNPLTARVAVNRVWARLFGRGLVATEEDFGSTGQAPSHPKLLDDLSVRFREDYKWSTKKLIREIVLSRTYRQSANFTKQKLAADPANRVLSRGPRQTLAAEMVRDQALAISGLMTDKMFGPPVHPPIPDGLWKPFASGDKWATPKPGEPDRYRRSVYTYTKRTIPFPIHATFDAPSREFCEPRRLRSNTPLQPLMTLNDEGFVECAEAFAKRMAAHSNDPKQQIAFGFQLATCRSPDDSELNRLLKLHESLESKNDEVNTVALQSVASVLLNLDEVLTK